MQSCVGVGVENGQMPHFPTGCGGFLAVEVKFHAGVSLPDLGPVRISVVPEIAQKVDHRGGSRQGSRAQREPAKRPDLLLELAGDRSFDRQVPRIMRSRGQFVDEQTPFGSQEELDRQHAHRSERLSNA
jgi:hypothetical protein